MTHPLEITVTEPNLYCANEAAKAIAQKFYGHPNAEVRLVDATAVMIDATHWAGDPPNQILAYFECRFQA